MPYTNYTLAQLRGLLRNQLGAAAATFWRDDELNAYLNETLRVWQALTGYWKRSGVALGSGSPATSIVDQTWYTLPGTITSGMRLRFNGLPLTCTSLDALDQGQPGWESETTASGGNVPTTPQLWAPAGFTMIVIWPADHAGGNALWADGIAQTPSLTTDGDYVDIGSEDLDAILNYAQHVATFKEGGQEFQATMGQMQGFLQAAGERNAMLKASAKYRKWAGLDDARDRNQRATSDQAVGAR